MTHKKNLFSRAVDAIIEGRAREARRYIAQFERDHARARDGSAKR